MNKMGVLLATLALAACANGSAGTGLGTGGGTTAHGGNSTGGASSTSSSSGTDGGASSSSSGSSSGHGSSSSSTSSTSSSGMVVCNAQNCAGSCCLGPTCTQYGMTDDQACGLEGQECIDCSSQGLACLSGYCQQ